MGIFLVYLKITNLKKGFEMLLYSPFVKKLASLHLLFTVKFDRSFHLVIEVKLIK